MEKFELCDHTVRLICARFVSLDAEQRDWLRTLTIGALQDEVMMLFTDDECEDNGYSLVLGFHVLLHMTVTEGGAQDAMEVN